VVRRVVFAVPGDLTIPTGGYAYDRRIIEGLRELGWRVDVAELGDGFPLPSEHTQRAAHARLAALPSTAPIVVDGLAFGALPNVMRELGASRRLIALVHHPLSFETELSRKVAEALRASEAEALRHACGVIATSAFTARLLVSDYGVAADRVKIVRPGNDRKVRARAAGKVPLALLCVGAIVPRKGYDVLVAALARLRDLPWLLTIVGDLTRDKGAAARLAGDVERFDLGDRVTIAGAVSEQTLDGHYARADMFVLASRFEGYGMAYAEAIAHGLPIVGTTGGAIPETAPLSAALLAPPDDVDAFAAAVRLLIEDSAERARLAAGAWAAAATLPTWEQSAKLFAGVIEDAA
jgi:glycosyltransferase involved in cell wall biosynthesis